MSIDPKKISIGTRFRYCFDDEFEVRGVIVYYNDFILVVRVGEGSMELITSFEETGFTYEKDELEELFPDFSDEGKRFIHEEYLVYNHQGEYFVCKYDDEYFYDEYEGLEQTDED